MYSLSLEAKNEIFEEKMKLRHKDAAGAKPSVKVKGEKDASFAELKSQVLIWAKALHPIAKGSTKRHGRTRGATEHRGENRRNR